MNVAASASIRSRLDRVAPVKIVYWHWRRRHWLVVTTMVAVCAYYPQWQWQSSFLRRQPSSTVAVMSRQQHQHSDKTNAKFDSNVLDADPTEQQNKQNNPNNQTFDWDILNTTERAANCGTAKCFFLDLHNPNYGYLIAADKKYYNQMLSSVEYALFLEKTYGAKHLYAGLPQHVPLPKEDPRQAVLARAVDQPHRRQANMGRLYKGQEFFRYDVYAVQKVARAPEPALTFGVSESKMKAIENSIPAFCQHISNFTAFDKQLRQDQKVVEAALKGDKLLWYDFQGMIDTEGNFWFIDLDGPMENPQKLEKTEQSLWKRYVQHRLDFLEKVRQLVKKQRHKDY